MTIRKGLLPWFYVGVFEFFLINHAWAAMTVAPIFNSGMVLQREVSVPVWGQAIPGDKVTVRFAGQEKTVTTDGNGKWAANLDPLKVNGDPQTMEITDGQEKLDLTNVLVGDVWLCTGQSNMAFVLSRVRDAQTEISGAEFPQIRIFEIPLTRTNLKPPQQLPGQWWECHPTTVSKVSATAYFFARDLNQKVHVPIGIVTAALVSSYAETWVSRQTQVDNPQTKPLVDAWDKINETIQVSFPANPKDKPTYTDQAGPIDPGQYASRFEKWKAASIEANKKGEPLPQDFPSCFEWMRFPPLPDLVINRPAWAFDSSIALLTPFPIKGVVWYQGESHLNPEDYGVILRELIVDWRKRFGEVPFLIVQLPNKGRVASQPVEGDWAFVREQQLQASRDLPNVYLTVNTDTAIFDKGNLHPTYKQPIGERLALLASANIYGQKIEASGPFFDKMSVDGNKIRVTFNHVGDGLKVVSTDVPGLPPELPKSQVLGFAVAGEDRVWRWAEATIENAHTVVVSSPQVPYPVAVRYNWADYPIGNLFNSAGLPAAPFRTDNWPLPLDLLRVNPKLLE